MLGGGNLGPSCRVVSPKGWYSAFFSAAAFSAAAFSAAVFSAAEKSLPPFSAATCPGELTLTAPTAAAGCFIGELLAVLLGSTVASSAPSPKNTNNKKQ